MTKRRYRVLMAAAVTPVVALASAMVSVSAQAAPSSDVKTYANGVTVDGEGRVDYNVDLAELPGATVYTDKGTRGDAGNCVFETAQRGKAGNAKILIITEISYDPTDCSRKLARAEYPRNNVPASVQAKIADQKDATTDESKAADKVAKAAKSKAGESSALAGGPWSGSLKVNVEDPPQIDVTSTKSFLTWRDDGTYLYSDHKAEWGWFTPSGWSRQSSRFSYDNNGSYAYTDVGAQYRNGIFCLTIDTHTYHNETYFEGWYDGWWQWRYSVDKSGGCTDLLHYEYIADTP